jgi:hypothetical protein
MNNLQEDNQRLRQELIRQQRLVAERDKILNTVRDWNLDLTQAMDKIARMAADLLDSNRWSGSTNFDLIQIYAQLARPWDTATDSAV